MPIPASKMNRRVWLWVGLLASIMALNDLPRAGMIYFRLGVYGDSPGRIDAYRRWRETHYVVRGRNPYDVAFAGIPAAARVLNPSDPQRGGRSTEPFPGLGWPEGVVYPPWAFPSLIPFFWPDVHHYLLYYGLWMLLGIAIVATWAGAEVGAAGAERRARVPAVAMALAVLGCNAWGGSLVVGNNPPIVVAALVVCYLLLQHQRPIAAGVMLALALMKPTLAGPFLLPLVLSCRWRTLLTAGAVIMVESMLTWWLTQTNPVDMLKQMVAMSRFYTAAGFGPTQYLIRAGIYPNTAGEIIAAAVLAPGIVGLFLLRKATLRAQFAVAAVIARFWSYHLDYDDAILIFVLVYFGVVLQSSRSATALLCFLLVCASLWMPGGLVSPHLAVQLFELLVWASAAIAVIFIDRSRKFKGVGRIVL